MAVEPSSDMMDQAACAAIRELLVAHGVPVAAFIDDHVANAIRQRDEARARISDLENMLRKAGYDEQQIAAGTPYVEIMGT